MADRPILFSAPMVRALLAGSKTQTRRVLPNSEDIERVERFIEGGWRFTYRVGRLPGDGLPIARPPRIGVGDRLYVREHWRVGGANDHLAPRDLPPEWAGEVEYLADGSDRRNGRFRQGMHMPRWASRLTLTVTDVRVQRLQEISWEDAEAEGVPPYSPPADQPPIEKYRHIWETINGPGSWDANPWVACYSFRVIPKNIDTLAGDA